MRLRDEFRDSLVCKTCGSPAARLGYYDTELVWHDRPLRLWKCDPGTGERFEVVREGRGGSATSESEWWLVARFLCTGDSPDGHRRDHACVPLREHEMETAVLPEWCHRERKDGDPIDVGCFIESKAEQIRAF